MGLRKSSIISNEEYQLEIPGYPIGSDLTILNTAYFYGYKDENGVDHKDFISITFKDNVSGEKKVHVIQEPLYTFYKLKDEYPKLEHNLFFIEKDKVEPVTCKYNELKRAIAEDTNNLDIYYDNMRSGNAKANKAFLTDIPDIFASDINIENYYRFLFNKSYTNEPFTLSKGFLDIETDGRYAVGDFPEMGEVPINAISYLDEANNHVYQFLLDDPKNPLIESYKQSYKNPKQMEKLKNFVIDAVGGWKKATKFGVDKLEYTLIFIKDELQMIQSCFDIINKTSPDIMLIWNMAFDLTYIMARIERLGGNPIDIITDPSIKVKYLQFYIDERNKNDYAERGDFVHLSSYTVWLDQMIQFASIRKGRGAFSSFRLDDIGQQIAGVRKLNYSHITSDINMLAYLDYQVFSFYNIMDTVVQKCIEKSTNDVDYTFTKCLMNNTVYQKCHRQSVYLANRFLKEFYEMDYILGNNRNTGNEKPATTYPGAMVGDPSHNSVMAFIMVNGVPTLLASNLIDFDFSALYPSICLEFNLAPNTQIGRLVIPEQIHDQEHSTMYTSDEDSANYSRGGEFLDNMMSGNILEFCRRWLGLGDIYDVINDIGEYFNFNKYYGKPMNWNPRSVMYEVRDDSMIDVFIPNNYSEQPVFISDNTLDSGYKKNLLEEVKKNGIIL